MKLFFVLFAFALGLLSSCRTSFDKIQKSKDYKFKLTKADDFFQQKKYAKANTLYEDILPAFKGTKEFEGIYYNYCQTFYHQGNYLAASYHFKNFTDIYPKSPRAEECEYLNALCLYKLSPDYTLDQSNTVKSIGEMQMFVNEHPTSKYVDEANRQVDECREKLEMKDLYGAQLYYKISEFKAAAVAFEQIIRKYPDSKNIDYYSYMIAKANYQYAKNSFPDKQPDRYSRVIADYNDFIKKFPNSHYRSELDKINGLCLQSLKKSLRHD